MISTNDKMMDAIIIYHVLSGPYGFICTKAVGVCMNVLHGVIRIPFNRAISLPMANISRDTIPLARVIYHKEIDIPKYGDGHGKTTANDTLIGTGDRCYTIASSDGWIGTADDHLNKCLNSDISGIPGVHTNMQSFPKSSTPIYIAKKAYTTESRSPTKSCLLPEKF